jgi:hypothetical protein
MPIIGDMYTFSKENVDKSPDQHGVYALYDGEELIYYGRAEGKGVTIRSRLQRHQNGKEGSCTQGATGYRREATERAKEREEELLNEYKRTHGGKLPRCNDVNV